MKTLILLMLGVATASAGGGYRREGKACNKMLLMKCLGKNMTEKASSAMEKCREMGRMPPSWEELKFLPDMLEAIMEADYGGGYKLTSSEEDGFDIGFPGEMMLDNDKQFNLDLSVSFPSKIMMKMFKMFKMMKRGMKHHGRRPEPWRKPYYGRENGYGSSEEFYGSSEEFKGGNNGEMTRILEKILAPVMAQVLRNKRSAENYDGKPEITQEYLVAKLNMIQMLMKNMSSKGLCLWKEMNLVDDAGNLNAPDTIDEAIDSYGIEDEGIVGQAKRVSRTCHQGAMSLPKHFHLLLIVNEEFGRALAYYTCVEDSMVNLCKNHDTRKQLEEHFGPISTLVEETEMDEEAILTLTSPLFLKDN